MEPKTESSQDTSLMSSEDPDSQKKEIMEVEGVDKVEEKEKFSVSSLPPIVPSFTANRDFKVKVGNKTISSSKRCRKWEWAPFTTSARSDEQQFRHWVRAGVEYPDYPYARFDIHLDPVQYTDDEYRKFLQHKTWTKSDTDRLMELARVFELRWAVIYDRWSSDVSQHKIEDLQHRFYTVAAILSQARITKEAASEVSALSAVPNADSSEPHLLEAAAARALASVEPTHQPLIENIATGTSNKEVFDLEKERERRAYLEILWKRTKEEEEEEQELRKELKLIESQLRKLKKSGGHVLAGASQSGSRNASRAVSPVPTAAGTAAMLEKSFASTAPMPMPDTPYLQSGRLVPPGAGGSLGINKATLKRMDTVLEELKVNKKPIPTKRICDLYDSVRKDILTLLILQKVTAQKEGQLQTKCLRLAKIGGGNVNAILRMDEEAIMGITPAPPPPPPAPAPRAKPKAKPRSSSAGAKGSKSAINKTSSHSSKADTGEKPKKSATKKRKSKADTKSASAATTANYVSDPSGIVTAPPVPVAKQPNTLTEEKGSGKKRARKA
mmetsp:Transcript_25075/g.37884  ORF Transcript_25075/g.37884 Transcript_25075/m.37884 type:complete len:555 (-) Transcript_25075:74-1738(-)|eukprot:CAMPEP_0194252230 /NCGR_PEP_ID=MMETSP0158-20130606/27099_1 /TAXON_ID=33649 /ORGANISM="Thalassionema nitzschioides, Strain L26-B" /LENGTH=554 /DNA_ID=CAMNT_0038989589 /DNA_START=81 /DNA_END=1745 /DNA_ORIENTATION=-